MTEANDDYNKVLLGQAIPMYFTDAFKKANAMKKNIYINIKKNVGGFFFWTKCIWLEYITNGLNRAVWRKAEEPTHN